VILYLDTSSLVKLYVEDGDSDRVLELVESGELTATSIVAYAEARAAFARRHRENALNTREYRRLVSSLNEDWENYLIVQVQDEIVRTAGELAEKHGLRGFDAIHLASAMALRNGLKTIVLFSSSDQRLNDASVREGFRLP
jgi:predicted nucleic acid-binding protein